jgi:cysteine-rich repeat protein
LNLVFLGAISVAIGACANPAVQECGATGVLCPAGTHCAAAQGICLPDDNTCGNARMDPGEVCDDGNTKDGDGCSADCLSDETCGNKIVDNKIKDSAGNAAITDPRFEDCDPPGSTDPVTGFVCSPLCKVEKCGNHVVDKEIGEVCDDGNTTGADGCSANCKSTEICGNGIVDREVGEVCEPPNVGGCSSDCRSTGACGNGIVDTDKGEECDDGVADDGTPLNGDDKDCRSDCVINRCGDGRPNTHGTLHHEDCDSGPKTLDHFRTAVPTESDTCNIDCTAAKCGDGKVNHSFKPNGTDGEQCDNINPTTKASLNSNDADCTASCLLNVCGDNLKNTAGPAHIEICDDGNRIDTDACTNTCVDSTCGDGIVDRASGEQCDLGKDQNGVSKNTISSSCPGCQLARCGDGKTEAGVETCDNGTNTRGSGCSPTCQQEACGNGIIDPGEECDKGDINHGNGNNDSGDCRTDCILNRCGDGYVNSLGTHKEDCEGLPPVGFGNTTVTPTETANCNINCTTPHCGDNILNRHFVPAKLVGGAPAAGPEQCDDGLRLAGDGCSPDCQFELCGNHVVDQGEECDGTPGCSSTCFLETCGNGIVDPGEECDDGDATHGNGNGIHADCRPDCVANRCGDGFRNDTVRLGVPAEQCDGGPQAAANDRTAIPTNTSNCNSNCKVPTCGDHVVNPLFVAQASPPAVPANTLPEQCDPPDPLHGCSAICRLENCGNGVKDPGEQCDDGDGVDGNACENDCTTPRCGNGIKDIGEQCDDGNSLNSDDCLNDCTFATCGDGFHRTITTPPPPSTPTIAEDCDDPTLPTDCPYTPLQPAAPCKVCNATCKLVDGAELFCGDGIVQPEEICDGGTRGCGACTTNCGTVISKAATGLILAAAGNAFAVGDHVDLSDDTAVALKTVFEFTTTGTHAITGSTLISVIGGAMPDTAAQVAVKISDAIANSSLHLGTRVVGGAVLLTHERQTETGNVHIDNHVVNTTFFVDGMTGGAGGKCTLGQPCVSPLECASNVCTGGICFAGP